jgi:hypothetical protein
LRAARSRAAADECAQERQRARRKAWEAGDDGENKPPRYFERRKNADGDCDYVFGGRADYWQAREKGDWPDFDLFKQE